MKILLISATEFEHGVESIYGLPIHIVGVGKVSSCFHTSILLEKYSPDLVINFGSCGDLKGNSVGSLIEVGKVHNDIDSHNLDVYGKTPFSDMGTINFNSNSKIECFSTDYFYNKESHNSYSMNYKNMIESCDIVDMELYSIAFCCKKKYPCRLCHDENEDHNMDRKKTENIVCRKCNLKQVVSNII